MPGKGTTDAMFSLIMLMEKYREGQRQLHCVFVDLEKAEDRVLRKELWYCMKKSGIAKNICAICTGYIRGKQNSGEMCNRNYRKFQGEGRAAPGISVKSVPLCSDYGKTNG